jgi:glycosyltransferase involved in cell wall biosynthesis
LITSREHSRALDPYSEAGENGLEEELAWIKEFERRHGRPLRVLHIGNIANNAYLNAVFLQRAGIECHVLCYDYYDLMATPEWESAPTPEWKTARPVWFVQGPQRGCLPYLHALLDDRTFALRLHALRMRALKWMLGHDNTRTMGVLTKSHVRRMRWRIAYAWSWSWSLTRWAFRRAARAVGLHIAEPPLGGTGASASSGPFERHRMELMQRFRELFPDRIDKLERTDFVLWGDAERWAELLDRYDVVQAYATDPILPMLAKTRPYVAYEHGTLRDFTLDDNPIHRLNALAYREADHVFITNGDCLAYARRLGIERFSPMVHPVDVDQHEQDFSAEVAAIRERVDADVLLFSPLRHDWAVKGTDLHIRALPDIAERRAPARVVLMLCEWGAEVDASRRLATSLGVDRHIVWLPPLNRRQLIAHMKAADVVLDQMTLPHFGATAPQALAAGTPVVMSYRPESTEWIVPEPAPILPAFDPAGVVEAVELALDAGWRREWQPRAKAWMHRHHHPRQVVVEHCRVYRRLLGDTVG